MKIALFPLLLAAGMAGLILSSGCLDNPTPLSNSSGRTEGAYIAGNVTQVEVVHFHPAQQCVSCRTLGEYARETVNTYFPGELSSGVLVYREINYQLPDNRDIVRKYRVTGSSLWIGIYGTDSFRKKENVNVWYKIGNKDEYMLYLKGVIERGLAGDLS